MNHRERKTTTIHIPSIKKKTIAMLLVMAIFISIIPDSFTASAAEAIEKVTSDTPALTMQFATNSTWGGSIAAEIILTNKSSKTIENWQITFDWEPIITSLWCAQYKTEEKTGKESAAEIQSRYTIYPYEYNQKISPGSEIRIGLIASGKEAELVEPKSYEIEIDGENWVYDTKEDQLKKPDATEEPTKEPEITKEPEVSATPEVTVNPTEEPEITAAPEITEKPTKEPEITTEPETSVTPEVTANPTEEPEITAAPEITEQPTEAPEITQKPTSEPQITPEPENTEAPTPTPEPTKEPDYNLEDHEFTDDLVITSDKTLTKNTSCKNLYIKKGTLNTDGYQLQVRENTIQTGGNLQVAKGSRLEIKKDYQQSSGTHATEAKTEVKGNYSLTGNALLRMKNAQSNVITHGDLTITSDGWQEIAEGELEIKRNLAIEPQWWIHIASSIKIKLSGSKTQKISTPNKSQLYHLDLTESAGAEFEDTIKAYTIKGIENLAGDTAAFEVDTVSIEKDTSVPCNIILKKGKWNTGKHSLTIEGSLNQESGRIDAEEGKLEIKGNYSLTGDALLHMQNTQSHVITHGDLAITSEGWQEIAEGELEIKGNLTIEPQWWIQQASSVKIKLSGSKTQKISTPNKSQLYHLDLTESAGAEFEDTIKAYTIKGIENLAGDTAAFEVNTVSIEKDTYISCDVILKKGEWNTGKHSLTIEGDLYQESGRIKAEEGKLEIWGDYRLGGDALLHMKNAKSHVITHGDFTVTSDGWQEIAEGELEIKGNLTIEPQWWIHQISEINITLSGSRRQKINVTEGTHLYNLDITQSKAAEFTTAIHADTLNGIEKLTGDEKILHVSQAYLTQDADLRGDLTIGEGRVNINGHRLRLRGDLTIEKGTLSTAVQNSHTDIRGKCVMQSGMLDIGKGSIQIQKKCQLNGMADINMNDKEGVLIIGKSLTADGHSQLGMTEGNVYIGGDLTQTEEAGWINLQVGAILHLNGEDTQTVSIGKPSALRFAHIDMTQSAGVTYASAVHIQKINGWDKLQGGSLILCGYNDICGKT